jgi:hypothetical protein
MNYTATPMAASSLSDSQSSEQTTGSSTLHHSRSSTSSTSGSSYFAYPVHYAVSGILRRLSSDPHQASPKQHSPLHHDEDASNVEGNGISAVYTPPQREASPFQPPPLTPLSLQGYREGTNGDAKLLSPQLAEEIRLLVPPRLQLCDVWKLAYSLERDGVSLSTLYARCEPYRGKRGGYVLVVRDRDGGVSLNFPMTRRERVLTAMTLTDIWGISLRRSTSSTTLLRHRRMLSVALSYPAFDT